VAAAETLHDPKGDPHVQIAVLNGDSKNQTAKEHHYGIIHVTGACVRCAHYAQGGKHHDRDEACHR